MNKDLLHSTGNYIQYPMINHNGKECEKEYMYNWITLLYSINKHNTGNQLHFNQINLKKKKWSNLQLIKERIKIS